MIAECTQCHTRFRIEDDKIGPKGVKARCAKCKTVFEVPPLEPPEVPVDAVENTSEKDFPIVSSTSQEAPSPPTRPPSQGDDDIFSLLSSDRSPSPASAPPSTAGAAASPATSPSANDDMPDFSRLGELPGEASPALETDSAIAKIELQKSHPGKKLPETLDKEPPPKVPTTQKFEPIVREPVPWKEQLARVALILGISLAGISTGLLIIGVQPTPEQLHFLVRYGLLDPPTKIRILEYDGTISRISSLRQRLTIHGTLFNHTPRAVSPPDLRAEVYGTDGSLIGKTVQPCCRENLRPGRPTSFSMQLEFDTTPAGRFKVEFAERSKAASTGP